MSNPTRPQMVQPTTNLFYVRNEKSKDAAEKGYQSEDILDPTQIDKEAADDIEQQFSG